MFKYVFFTTFSTDLMHLTIKNFQLNLAHYFLNPSPWANDKKLALILILFLNIQIKRFSIIV